MRGAEKVRSLPCGHEDLCHDQGPMPSLHGQGDGEEDELDLYHIGDVEH